MYLSLQFTNSTYLTSSQSSPSNVNLDWTGQILATDSTGSVCATSWPAQLYISFIFWNEITYGITWYSKIDTYALSRCLFKKAKAPRQGEITSKDGLAYGTGNQNNASEDFSKSRRWAIAQLSACSKFKASNEVKDMLSKVNLFSFQD